MARRKMQMGVCRVCGDNKNLSFEHVPPRIAFNGNTKYLSVPFDDYVKIDNPMKTPPKGKVVQGGTGYYALCQECNSFLGVNYVNAYERWAKAAFQVISGNQYNHFKCTIRDLEPLKILKQIISMFLTMNNDWYGKAYPELIEFVKDRDNGILPDKFKVFAFLNNEGQMRFSKYTVSFTPEFGILTSSELVFPPFGYVLTINFPNIINRMTNITNFKTYSFDQKTDLSLEFVKLPTYLPFPLDYRPKEQIEKDIEAGILARDSMKPDSE